MKNSVINMKMVWLEFYNDALFDRAIFFIGTASISVGGVVKSLENDGYNIYNGFYGVIGQVIVVAFTIWAMLNSEKITHSKLTRFQVFIKYLLTFFVAFLSGLFLSGYVFKFINAAGAGLGFEASESFIALLSGGGFQYVIPAVMDRFSNIFKNKKDI